MAIERIRVADMAARFPGTTRHWWRTRMPELALCGVVRRHGRFYFGDVAEIDRWLAGGAALGDRARFAALRDRLARAGVLLEGVVDETHDRDLVAALGEIEQARELLGAWVRDSSVRG